MTREEFANVAPSIPHQPGCYRYYSSSGELLYVGKAKDLRKRVASYFNKNAGNSKTRRLVSLIDRIEFTVTDSEHDAFLLENSLIKHYRPRYNIELKDDKSYPFVVIKKENFPRVFLTRNIIRDGSEYIGPFTDVGQVKELLELIRQNIPLRNCSLNLSPGNINRGKFKVCLEYHLGNCMGPCEGLQSEEDYGKSLQQVRHLLKGKLGEVVRWLRERMAAYAAEMEFEKAAVVKTKIDALQNYSSKSTVVNPHLGDLDVASILSDEGNAFVHYMMVRDGSIIYAQPLHIEKKLEESEAEMLSLAVDRFREKFKSEALEIVVPMEIDVTHPQLKITIPKAGDKKKLLDLSFKNANFYRNELRRKASLMTGTRDPNQTLELLQQALHLPELPVHIECFDNSNFQGSFPVAAMVCFRDGKPFKQDYRHFHIKTVTGIDDFASMQEVVLRRYKRLKEEGRSLPQLVIIDGGKGQLGAAMESIRQLELVGKMTVVGLAKREESIFFPGDKEPLQLPYDHPAHLLIRSIRDEVHRFGLKFHRNQRSKGTIKNELELIPGIGEKTATELLKEFRSVQKIRTLTERELTRIIGASKARIVYQYFNESEG